MTLHAFSTEVCSRLNWASRLSVSRDDWKRGRAKNTRLGRGGGADRGEPATGYINWELACVTLHRQRGGFTSSDEGLNHF